MGLDLQHRNHFSEEMLALKGVGWNEKKSLQQLNNCTIFIRPNNYTCQTPKLIINVTENK